MRDRHGVSTMASGVAATRLKKLHFTNWLNWNCESLVWVGGFVSGLAWCEIGVAGIRTIYCGNLQIPSWIICSWHSLAKVHHPLIVLREYRKASRGKALANTSARWWVSSACLFCWHFLVQCALTEVVQLNRKVLSSWAKFMSVREFKCADVVFKNSAIDR